MIRLVKEARTSDRRRARSHAKPEYTERAASWNDQRGLVGPEAVLKATDHYGEVGLAKSLRWAHSLLPFLCRTR